MNIAKLINMKLLNPEINLDMKNNLAVISFMDTGFVMIGELKTININTIGISLGKGLYFSVNRRYIKNEEVLNERSN